MAPCAVRTAVLVEIRSHECVSVYSAADAVEAVKLGVSGILVSNHGGRQLDTVPATVSQ